MYGNLIARKIKVEEFIQIIEGYKSEQIECTDHTFFRLSEKQRKIFKCEKLKEYILHDTPIMVGIQNNGNYALFYKHEKKIMRMIADIQHQKVKIVSFYFTHIPKI